MAYCYWDLNPLQSSQSGVFYPGTENGIGMSNLTLRSAMPFGHDRSEVLKFIPSGDGDGWRSIEISHYTVR